jgi:hypothetical protein
MKFEEKPVPVKKTQPSSRSVPRRSTSKPGVRKPGARHGSIPATRGSYKSRKSRFSWNSLSAERKLDVVGIVLALAGLFTLLSLISSQRSSITGGWIDLLMQIAGWGTFILPVVLIGFGLWLLFRKIERLPPLSLERAVGLILLYLNILLLAAGWNWQNRG